MMKQKPIASQYLSASKRMIVYAKKTEMERRSIAPVGEEKQTQKRDLIQSVSSCEAASKFDR